MNKFTLFTVYTFGTFKPADCVSVKTVTPVTSHQSPVTSHQSPVTSHQSATKSCPVEEHESCQVVSHIPILVGLIVVPVPVIRFYPNNCAP